MNSSYIFVWSGGLQTAKIAIIVPLQDNPEQDVGKEKTEIKEKEGHQETVDTPLTSPSEEMPVQVQYFRKLFACFYLERYFLLIYFIH